MNDATMVVVMMETVAALEHVEEIAAVDGVDLMLVGTNDLCNEMGISGQSDHPNCTRCLSALYRRLPEARQACRCRWIGIAA